MYRSAELEIPKEEPGTVHPTCCLSVGGHRQDMAMLPEARRAAPLVPFNLSDNLPFDPHNPPAR